MHRVVRVRTGLQPHDPRERHRPRLRSGLYLQPLLDSLDRQTLASDRFEVIFVDDGSTDDTAGLLDAWAAARPNVQVFHQENHGWPGQPRNFALEHARGEYVYFVDQDDWLGDEALERMTDYARENRSDVVVGKMLGIDRPVPVAIFARSHPRARIGEVPLQDSQTPHKMFRRAFLDEIGLRFPEGRRRLEDHLFVTTAFLRAEVVSVYSDYDCYIHIRRDDGGNAAFRTYEPVAYYSNLEDVLDVIDEFLPAGSAKDSYLERWIRTELVGRLRAKEIRTDDTGSRRSYYAEISRILRDRIPQSAIRSAYRKFRLAAALARSADESDYFRIDGAMQAVELRTRLTSEGVRVRLQDGARVLPADATLSALLHKHASSEQIRTVVADLGTDEALLAPSLSIDLRDGRRITATRRGGTDLYAIERAVGLGIEDLEGATISLASIAGYKTSVATRRRMRPLIARARRRSRTAVRSGLHRVIGRARTERMIQRLRGR